MNVARRGGPTLSPTVALAEDPRPGQSRFASPGESRPVLFCRAGARSALSMPALLAETGARAVASGFPVNRWEGLLDMGNGPFLHTKDFPRRSVLAAMLVQARK